ncbi:hypothetical protein NIES2119_32075 [[Phormidium ambiguum] IAM M-71]|uniref:DUF6788 domain-containing protein n=1 Tax=[Phormidium ambiguum] IAM M-71 TaxID=454136 RepID=A0A1U7I126_9CYAN|nr:hypothetical protein [Phormidium ambiguum]OKH29621.1 hypothetical protein NIES2119_32075 [Phormidium ambiguum IAM M-71]
MSKASNSVTEGILELSSNKFLEVGGALWFKALDELTSFRFEGKDGSFTARKERPLKKRSEDTGSGEPEYSDNVAYWYAYRKVEGKTRKRYIGKTEDLTQERLEEIATLLDQLPEKRQPKEETANFDSPYRLLENKLWIAQENNKSLQAENEELKTKLFQLEGQLEQMKSQAIAEVTDRNQQQTLVTGYDLLNIVKGKNPKTKIPVKELCWIAEAINDGTIIPGNMADMVEHYKKEAKAMSEAFHDQHNNYIKLRDRTVGKKSGW